MMCFAPVSPSIERRRIGYHRAEKTGPGAVSVRTPIYFGYIAAAAGRGSSTRAIALDQIGSVAQAAMVCVRKIISDKLIEFLEALIKDAEKKVFLILDNLHVHHSKPVKAWVEER